jgi:hypothetical protein
MSRESTGHDLTGARCHQCLGTGHVAWSHAEGTGPVRGYTLAPHPGPTEGSPRPANVGACPHCAGTGGSPAGRPGRGR